MLLLGSDVLSRLGLKKNELMEMDVKVQVANGELLECLGGVPLRLSIYYGVGCFEESRQLCYTVYHPTGLIVHYTLLDLGLIPMGFLNQVPEMEFGAVSSSIKDPGK